MDTNVLYERDECDYECMKKTKLIKRVTAATKPLIYTFMYL
jgi:hypothetical protein